jgi:hypothetical protein
MGTYLSFAGNPGGIYSLRVVYLVTSETVAEFEISKALMQMPCNTMIKQDLIDESSSLRNEVHDCTSAR